MIYELQTFVNYTICLNVDYKMVMVYSQRVSILFFLMVFKNEVYGGASITISDKMLVRNVFMTKPKQNWLQCLELCINDPRCFAYSFGPVGEEIGRASCRERV